MLSSLLGLMTVLVARSAGSHQDNFCLPLEDWGPRVDQFQERITCRTSLVKVCQEETVKMCMNLTELKCKVSLAGVEKMMEEEL